MQPLGKREQTFHCHEEASVTIPHHHHHRIQQMIHWYSCINAGVLDGLGHELVANEPNNYVLQLVLLFVCFESRVCKHS